MRSYRDIETAPIETAAILREAAEAALTLLAREGTRGASEEPERADHSVWRLRRMSPAGVRFEIACVGPDLPETIPDEVIRPGAIAAERPFFGTYRLTVKAPILVLDFYWRADSKLRIMTFANGDWQHELVAMAAGLA